MDRAVQSRPGSDGRPRESPGGGSFFHRSEFRKAKEQLERPQEVTEATGSGCSLAERGKSHALA